QILEKALEMPLRQIADNAGEKGDVIVENVKEKGGNYGYNAAKNDYEEDMVAAGIIDPAKVTRSALENAASIANMVITTEAAITEIPKQQNEPAPQMPAGGMGMY
ncbi:molecular chaperone GroEL, partial [Candidatus Parcubacteria bacterium]